MATSTPHRNLNPLTMYDKIWLDHVVIPGSRDDVGLVYVDRHLVHELSPQAFEGLRLAKRSVRRPDCTLATMDHNVPTSSREGFPSLTDYVEDPNSRAQCLTLEKNARKSGIMYYGLHDKRQGIVHVISAEQGFTLPGTICVCGDSHTSTLGAFGSLAFGIGTSEVEHVLATQTLLLKKAKNMRITVDGVLAEGVTSKDVILHIISTIGTAGGTGCVIEYAGSIIRNFSMESRLTVCNMTIEAGARAGLIAPDDVTFAYLRDRPFAPASGDLWTQAESHWRSLVSDDGAVFDVEVHIQAEEISPTVTWGTSPEDSVPITGVVPDPASVTDPRKRSAMESSLSYMGLNPGTRMEDISLDKVFIGSCTNSRIEDLRSAVSVIQAVGPDAKVATSVLAMVVPGSGVVKRQAEEEGLDVVFKRTGFEWREAGCSMCIGLNPDQLGAGERCASTSNRNFRGRQGPGGRTHLVSPAMATAAALTGKLTDVRKLIGRQVSITNTYKPASPPSFLYADSHASFDQPSLSFLPEEGPKSDDGGFRQSTQFVSVKGIAAPLRLENVDTDTIIPAHQLKGLGRTGLASGLFYGLRQDLVTGEKTDFVLNRQPFTSAKILICTGQNFGCGSSREHAAWSLKDFGISCVIAPSFSDIFFGNCLQNGILAVKLSKELCDTLAQDASAGFELEVDLVAEEIRRIGCGLPPISFKADTLDRQRLLQGLDDIAITLTKVDAISTYEKRRREMWPWLELGQGGRKRRPSQGHTLDW